MNFTYEQSQPRVQPKADPNYFLHDETLNLVKEERRLTGLVIENLQKIQDSKLYLKMGYSSLFEYAVKALGYSESCAYRRTSAVKMARVMPEIKQKLNSGELNLTNLSMAQGFFAKVNADLARQKEILEKIENCSKRETEKILVREFGTKALAPKREVVQTASGDEALLHVRLKHETLKKLDRLKSLRAHKNPRMSYADLIDDMCEYMLKKLDPMKGDAKSRTAIARPKLNKPGHPHASPRYISPQLKRRIWQRDQGRCTYRDPKTDRRCESHHLLQIDHVLPVCRGGQASEQNLRLLCHAHHRLRELES